MTVEGGKRMPDIAAIVAAMSNISATMESIHRDQRADRALLTDVRERVIRMEAGEISKRLTRIEEDIAKLWDDKTSRDGANSALFGLWKQLPSIAAAIVAVVAIVIVWLRVSGRMP